MPRIHARDGTSLFVKVWGEGRPVVLIHGWPLNADSWDPVALALAESGYRAIAYDRRGFGRSDQPWNGYDYNTLADDLLSVLQAFGGGEPAALVGFSMGGGEVARYLSRHGTRGIERVALIGSVVPAMRRDDENPDGVPQTTFDAMAQGIREDRARFLSGFFDDFFGIGLLSRPVSDEVLRHAWSMAMMAGLRPTLAAAEAFYTTDFRNDLSSFTVPTLVIHGTADKTVPIEATARVVAEAIPGVQSIEYTGAAHGLFATHTDRLVEDLLDFLGGQAKEDRLPPGIHGDTPDLRPSAPI